MMRSLLDWFASCAIVVLACSVCFFVGKGCAKSDYQKTAFVKLNDNVGQSETRHVSAEELEQKAKKTFDGAKIQYDNLESLTDATYLIRSYARNNTDVDYRYLHDGKLGYIFHEIHLDDGKGVVGPAIGYVMIYSNGKVVSKVYNHKVEVHTLLSKDKDYYRVINSADLIMLQSGLAARRDSVKKDWKLTPFPLPIENATTLISLQSKDKIVFDFSPDLSLNGVVVLGTGELDWLPTIGFSLLNYGNSERIRWRFVRLGVGLHDLNNGPTYTITPALYNIHKQVRIFDNTYVGPFVGYDKRKFNLGAGLALQF